MSCHLAVVSLLLIASAAPQDAPKPLGDHLEPTAAIDREHAHHASIEGTVLDADGKPVPAAKVYVYGQLPWYGPLVMASGIADEAGRYRIDDIEAVGQLALFATTPDAARFACAWSSLGLVSGQHSRLRPLTLPKPEGGEPHTFRGRLVDAAGAPVCGALWRLHHEKGFDPGAFAITDADGRFEIRCGFGRPNGGTLFVGRSKFQLEHKDGAEHLPSDGGLYNDLDLAIERTIKAPSVESIRLEAPGVDGATFHESRGHRLVPCPGNVALLRRSEFSGSQVDVCMRAPGRLPRFRTLPGQTFDVAGDRARSLRVVDDAGAPVGGATVDVCASGSRFHETTLATFRTGADGGLELQGPADEHVVYVYAAGHAPARAHWHQEKPLVVRMERCVARLELAAGVTKPALYVRRAGTFASCAKLYPQGDAISVAVAPGDYELTVYGDRGIEAAAAVHVAGDMTIAMPTEDLRPELIVTVANAAAGDACWVHASRSAAGGMITKWSIHTQRGGPVQRHELAATVDVLDAEADADGKRRFRVRPPTSGRYTLLIGNGNSHRYFRESTFAFGGKYTLELPPMTGSLHGTVSKYPEFWTDGGIHGVVGPRLSLEPVGETTFGALIALPEPAEFKLTALPLGPFALHHHLYETGILMSTEGTWGGTQLTISADAPAVAKDLARGPDGEIVVHVRDRDGKPVAGRLSIRDRMFECWADDLRQNTTLDGAMDPIPTPPAVELVDGKGTLKNVRSGRLAFVLDFDDGATMHFARDVEVGKTLEVVLAALPR